MPNHATALAIILLAIFSVFPVQTVQSAVSADIDGSDLDFAQHAQHGRGRNHGRLHRDNLHDDIADLPSSNQSMLMRRDDYSCGPGNPCSNGACCGVSGYCGYGDTYCGKGCSSNCGAKAECGENAVPAGKKCPLNTCCSQYGFCGTTEDFCTNKCQSNCVLNPKPTGSKGAGVLSKVIGYYESWSARSKCHNIKPTDLPLDALTHVNYAFAYIDPSSYEIVTMDPETPASSFQDVTDLKQYKSDLQVFVSVGGWTFSDNGTATQPVFGDIASTAANRAKFAKNVVKFMNQYGFDGLDIDWEYPGAPDRGGQERDTENFVLLMETLRNSFNAEARSLGLTFTAPSSYWYLRNFDLPGLLKHTDWINLMTYDLHGVWDRNNPIGSIVQGHTNLTEIKLAAELFWRVDVPPEKVVMGFGFYGRSFHLADTSCTTPGCPFSGSANEGPCSAASGILEYYEIQALLKQNPGLKPVHDQAAAVDYLVFDNNQWVSYDTADTFKQKVDWANGIGLGGALIWASDTDDDQYSAHKGLTGKSAIGHINLEQDDSAFSAKQVSIAQNLIGQNGQDCTISSDCTDQNNPVASSCSPGVKVGWERGKCGKNYAHSICCPAATAPKSCIWRGSGGDCNGQCHAGEAALFNSSWGGSPTESNQNKCSRGYKQFCCAAGDWSQVTENCRWTKCGGSCTNTETQVSTRYNSADCTVFSPNQQYCCTQPANLQDCTWRGSQPDCPDAKCLPGEVAIDTNPQGRGYASCSWGRKKIDCCTVSKPSPQKILCPLGICDFDPGQCDSADDQRYSKRSVSVFDFDSAEATSEEAFTGLVVRDNPAELIDGIEERFGERKYLSELTSFYILWRLATGPSRGDLFRSRQRLQLIVHRWLRMQQDDCGRVSVVDEAIDPNNPPRTGQTEHPIDGVTMDPFGVTIGTGFLPSGAPTRTSPLPLAYLRSRFQQDSLPSNAALQPVGGADGVNPLNPTDRISQAFGSYNNPSPFILTDRQINVAKGALFSLNPPLNTDNLQDRARTAIRSPTEFNLNRMFAHIRATIAVFPYTNNALVTERMNLVRSEVRTQCQAIEQLQSEARGLTALWDEFLPDWLQEVQNYGQAYVLDGLRAIESVWRREGRANARYNDVLSTIDLLRTQVQNMRFPTLR